MFKVRVSMELEDKTIIRRVVLRRGIKG